MKLLACLYLWLMECQIYLVNLSTFSPVIGAVGAFLAGSNTVSNLMLSQFQYETANLLGLSGALMVAA